MGNISFLFLILGLSVIYVGSQITGPDEVLQSYEHLNIVPRQRTLFSYMGIIPGSRQCGGAGKSLMSRNEACLTNQPGKVCNFPAGRGHLGEITFVASKASKFLGVVAVVSDSQNGEELYRSPRPLWLNVGSEAGKEYELHYSTGAIPEVRGKIIKGQWLIYRLDDMQLELCSEALFNIT